MKVKLRPIYFLFFSLFFIQNFAQENEQIIVKEKYQPNFIVGFDVVNAGISFFSDRKVYQGFISSKIKKNIHAVIDLGYENNIYQKNGYDAEVMGHYVKLGAFYMLIKDPENEFNGFYGGGKLGASNFQQEYFSVPVRGFNGSSSTLSFPNSTQSAYWVEAVLGGRIQLFSTSFYVDVNLQPKYLAYATKQDEIQPMIVPGFGKSSAKFNLAFAWSISYKF